MNLQNLPGVDTLVEPSSAQSFPRGGKQPVSIKPEALSMIPTLQETYLYAWKAVGQPNWKERGTAQKVWLGKEEKYRVKHQKRDMGTIS